MDSYRLNRFLRRLDDCYASPTVRQMKRVTAGCQASVFPKTAVPCLLTLLPHNVYDRNMSFVVGSFLSVRLCALTLRSARCCCSPLW